MKSLQEAGYAASHLAMWRRAARAAKGMIIVSGVTGSGKSTSLKLFIEQMPGLNFKAIYSVEDPIEYEMLGVHQIEVLRDLASEDETARRYAAAFKALLRADPDGVIVGEIRDRITANFVLQMAETGHLVMSTLHAHLLTNMVPRLTNEVLGLSRQALASPNIINLLVYQSLVPLVCTTCAMHVDEAVRLDADTVDIVRLLGSKFGLDVSSMRFKREGGCPLCRGRGTRGKTIVAEMWQPDRQWLQYIRENDDYGALTYYRSHSDANLTSSDMTGKTVFEHTLYKATLGLVDPRSCEEFESFDRFELGLARPLNLRGKEGR
jgi:general secretion pathway protein E